jgi:hypothetical protein
MTTSEKELDALVKRSVQVKIDHATLCILEMMRVAISTLNENDDCTLQSRVHRVSLHDSHPINNHPILGQI